MASITFDTHAYVKRLKSVGITEEQAEVFADEQRKVLEEQVATKSDVVAIRDGIKILEVKMVGELNVVKGEINLVKWMLGVVLAIEIANFAKQFF
jgi:hypothetical protein